MTRCATLPNCQQGSSTEAQQSMQATTEQAQILDREIRSC